MNHLTCRRPDIVYKLEFVNTFNHGTIIRTGITYKKIPYCMRGQACFFIVENAKIFLSYMKHL